ncbi:MAG: hypothetical protein DMF50_10690 [Acidobacteria bacterium]|nr:MAG: hypothetical protein DMF50_10690 [Acidobacteriota bacterium]
MDPRADAALRRLSCSAMRSVNSSTSRASKSGRAMVSGSNSQSVTRRVRAGPSGQRVRVCTKSGRKLIQVFGRSSSPLKVRLSRSASPAKSGRRVAPVRVKVCAPSRKVAASWFS